MNAFAWIELALGLLRGIVSHLKSAHTNEKIVGEIEGAVVALERVVGSAVTKQQLEAMRYTPKW